jgi:hypothetical protein
MQASLLLPVCGLSDGEVAQRRQDLELVHLTAALDASAACMRALAGIGSGASASGVAAQGAAAVAHAAALAAHTRCGTPQRLSCHAADIKIDTTSFLPSTCRITLRPTCNPASNPAHIPGSAFADACPRQPGKYTRPSGLFGLGRPFSQRCCFLLRTCVEALGRVTSRG